MSETNYVAYRSACLFIDVCVVQRQWRFSRIHSTRWVSKRLKIRCWLSSSMMMQGLTVWHSLTRHSSYIWYCRRCRVICYILLIERSSYWPQVVLQGKRRSQNMCYCLSGWWCWWCAVRVEYDAFCVDVEWLMMLVVVVLLCCQGGVRCIPCWCWVVDDAGGGVVVLSGWSTMHSCLLYTSPSPRD